MNHMYISPGIIDGAVVHKQAQQRLMDKYSPSETVVHAHAHEKYCNDQCVIYKFPQMICPDCEGYGNLKKEQRAGLAKKFVDTKCVACGGTGEIRDPDRQPGEEDEPDQNMEAAAE